MASSTRGSRVQYHCSFCGKNQDQGKRLIAGPGAVYICDECVELCQEIINEETQAAGKTPAKGPVAPTAAPADPSKPVGSQENPVAAPARGGRF